MGLLSLFLAMLLMISCKQEDNDELETASNAADDCSIGLNTFSAKIDGVTETYGGLNVNRNYPYGSGTIDTLISIAGHAANQGSQNIYLIFDEHFQGDTVQLGVVPFSHPSVGFGQNLNRYFTHYEPIKGKLIICEHDTISDRIKGYFDATVVTIMNQNPNFQSDTIVITEASFHIRY